MKKTLPLVLAAAALFTLSVPACSSCDAATQQALVTPYGKHKQEGIDLRNNVISILRKVDSPSSANDAAARLRLLVEQDKSHISRGAEISASTSREIREKASNWYIDTFMGCMQEICVEAVRPENADFYGSAALKDAVIYFTGNTHR